MFPMDTIKTVMQVRQSRLPTLAVESGAVTGGSAGSTCPGVVGHWASLTQSGGMGRMWRGVQTMFTGCIPAHAAYFSVYEGCKAAFNAESAAPPSSSIIISSSSADGDKSGNSSSSSSSCCSASSGNSPFASGAAVALATMCHDVIMTPMDCIKQRLQLGYHSNSVYDCACAMFRQEGPRAFMLSYPTTLLMNVPYALVMGTSNEAIRNALNPGEEYSLSTYIAAGAGSGMIAAAVTNPLDVVKTRLQTQHLRFANLEDIVKAETSANQLPCPRQPIRYTGMLQAARTLLAEEGAAIFARGMQARMLIHAPSVAICWTTYESVKHLLVGNHILE